MAALKLTPIWVNSLVEKWLYIERKLKSIDDFDHGWSVLLVCLQIWSSMLSWMSRSSPESRGQKNEEDHIIQARLQRCICRFKARPISSPISSAKDELRAEFRLTWIQPECQIYLCFVIWVASKQLSDEPILKLEDHIQAQFQGQKTIFNSWVIFERSSEEARSQEVQVKELILNMRIEKILRFRWRLALRKTSPGSMW